MNIATITTENFKDAVTTIPWKYPEMQSELRDHLDMLAATITKQVFNQLLENEIQMAVQIVSTMYLQALMVGISLAETGAMA